MRTDFLVSQSRPIVWLGQSVDTSSLCAAHAELSQMPFITSLGCAIRKPALKQSHFTSNLRKKLGVTGPLMVDSGGFALMLSPKSDWTLDHVSSCVQRIDADIFVSLDYPPTKRDSGLDRRNKIKHSVNNFGIMKERFQTKTIMPVVHGRTLHEIELSVELIARHCEGASWIGLGGVVPLLQHRAVSGEISRIGPEAFIAKSLSIIRGIFPRAKVHVFGAGGTRTFAAVVALGAQSADSIGWRQAAGYGSIFLPLKSQCVINWDRKSKPPRRFIDKDDLAQLELCRCPICAGSASVSSRLKHLQVNFYNRSIHNAWVVTHQMDYWPRTRDKMISLVSSEVLGSAWARATELLM
jgi:queuine/archaeosine tRNA-ribosyltransferase